MLTRGVTCSQMRSFHRNIMATRMVTGHFVSYSMTNIVQEVLSYFPFSVRFSTKYFPDH